MSSLYVDNDYWGAGYAQTGITIDWKNRIIFVPKTESIQIQTTPTEIRQLDLNAFRQTLNDLEDDEDGMTFPDTHDHNTTVTVGGAVLARVVQIINGYTVTFEDGQYAINLVGANSNVGDVVNVNQVSVRSSNSAGLQDLTSLQAASFAGGVAINPVSPYSGTLFPVGTRQFPVNNMADAVAICTARGLKDIYVMSPLSLVAGDIASGLRFVGDNINIGISIDAAATVSNCEFTMCTVSGSLDNNNLLRECLVANVYHINGIIYNSGLIGTVSVSGVNPAVLLECFSIIKDGNPSNLPALDLTMMSSDVTMRAYNGELHVENSTNASSTLSLDFDAGTLYLNPSCTDGTAIVRGNCEIVNNSSMTFVDKTLQKAIPDGTWNRSVVDVVSGESFGAKIRRNLLR